jgi:hypothetical protein
LRTEASQLQHRQRGYGNAKLLVLQRLASGTGKLKLCSQARCCGAERRDEVKYVLCRYAHMCESLRGVIYGNAASEACQVTDTETNMGVYVSMRMRLACEIKRAGQQHVAERYEV